MLNLLEEIFQKHYSQCKKRIKDFSASCCGEVNTECYYFDEVTKLFFQFVKVGDFLPSVDILHFSSTSHTMVLGEMTSYRNYANRVGKFELKDCLVFVRDQLINSEFREKIINSQFTIKKIMEHYGMDPLVHAYLNDKTKFTQKNYLVLDVTYEEYIYLEFSCLDKLEQHKTRRIEGEVNLANCDGFEAVLKELS